ncbi:hypothetical protein DA803_01590 [[Mycoplasma] phocae]|uniref:Lipoprotein n=1 Tax=[Mycoplasma] phocae TaxID=142651 RepID=A0A2Z5ISL4_9BACT|nr:hypothetical protein [[Mycoplasma] phocae]AXE60778.1 hypothetical protein DA803_01590 [[Mycoplasma] phocae]
MKKLKRMIISIGAISLILPMLLVTSACKTEVNRNKGDNNTTTVIDNKKTENSNNKKSKNLMSPINKLKNKILNLAITKFPYTDIKSFRSELKEANSVDNVNKIWTNFSRKIILENVNKRLFDRPIISQKLKSNKKLDDFYKEIMDLRAKREKLKKDNQGLLFSYGEMRRKIINKYFEFSRISHPPLIDTTLPKIKTSSNANEIWFWNKYLAEDFSLMMDNLINKRKKLFEKSNKFIEISKENLLILKNEEINTEIINKALKNLLLIKNSSMDKTSNIVIKEEIIYKLKRNLIAQFENKMRFYEAIRKLILKNVEFEKINPFLAMLDLETILQIEEVPILKMLFDNHNLILKLKKIADKVSNKLNHKSFKKLAKEINKYLSINKIYLHNLRKSQIDINNNLSIITNDGEIKKWIDKTKNDQLDKWEKILNEILNQYKQTANINTNDKLLIAIREFITIPLEKIDHFIPSILE